MKRIQPAAHELARHETLDLALRQRASRIATDFFVFAEEALEFIELKGYEYFGFLTETDYFAVRVGISYRAIRRWLSVAEAVRRLPPEEQNSARGQLATVGGHKAAVLVPLIGQTGWETWIEKALALSEDQLQTQVSRALGHKPRGEIAEPGERFERYVLNMMPDEEARVLAARFFAVGKRATENDNAVRVFLAGCQECLGSWEPKRSL